MPGRRNYHSERARHKVLAPDLHRQIYQTMVDQLPERDRALVGRDAILAFLRALGLTRRNGASLTWRMILRWRRDLGFPLLRGVWHPTTRNHLPSRSPALTTSYAVTAWVLSQFSTDSQGLFRVYHPTALPSQGRRPAASRSRNPDSAPGVGRGRWVRPLVVARLAERV